MSECKRDLKNDEFSYLCDNEEIQHEFLPQRLHNKMASLKEIIKLFRIWLKS